MTEKLLILDNFDSLTYNLLHYCEAFPGIYCEVRRNNEVDAAYCEQFDSLLLSPGPGLPADAGNMMAILGAHAHHKKIWGVCLGMQAIGEHFGAGLVNGAFPMHGRISNLNITDTESVLYRNIPSSIKVGRYHSWMIDSTTLPDTLIPTAWADDGSLQSIRHLHLPIEGVQYHPESILTEFGRTMVYNWLLS